MWRVLETMMQVGAAIHVGMGRCLLVVLLPAAVCLPLKTVPTHLHTPWLVQVSPRGRWLVFNDWVRAALFGRNISDI